MSKGKFVLNRKGVRELMRSQEAMAVCTEKANEIQKRAGAEYEVTTHTGKNRVNASVHAATYKAKLDNAENNTLLKALGGGV